ncbi:hypothetical protein Scep_026611 [Stephania cephalantha]|uniref:Uncharacterized protein n=1 Tax=Stephania cephalantha TaxID=152367 RepID=A0AAP0HS73_9MAGN
MESSATHLSSSPLSMLGRTSWSFINGGSPLMTDAFLYRCLLYDCIYLYVEPIEEMRCDLVLSSSLLIWANFLFFLFSIFIDGIQITFTAI